MMRSITITIIFLIAYFAVIFNTDAIPYLGSFSVILPVIVFLGVFGYQAIRRGKPYLKFAITGAVWGLVVPWVVFPLINYVSELRFFLYLDFVAQLICMVEDCSEAWFLQLFTLFISFPIIGFVLGFLFGLRTVAKTRTQELGLDPDAAPSYKLLWIPLILAVLLPIGMLLGEEILGGWKQQKKDEIRQEELQKFKDALRGEITPEECWHLVDNHKEKCFTLVAMHQQNEDACLQVTGRLSETQTFQYNRFYDDKVALCEIMVRSIKNSTFDRDSCDKLGAYSYDCYEISNLYFGDRSLCSKMDDLFDYSFTHWSCLP